MMRFGFLVVIAGTLGALSLEAEDVVYRSDVSLVRVDAQVVDHGNRAISGLHAEDFILREEGRQRDIRNFVRESMPVDVLLLFDVSRSMRPHVERIASAAHTALGVLGDQDRVGIMVFDRSSRLRLPFQTDRQKVERELDAMLKHESFNGGTDITRGLLDAAAYVGREGRRDARRAIVVVTDDETERDRDEAAVNRALTRADAVLSALIAPDAMRYGRTRPDDPSGSRGGGYPGGGGGYPGGGGNVGMGGPLGGIILGRRGGNGGRPPYGGRGGSYPSHTQSAGTAEIARQSGGDSMGVDDASALEDTLARIRQRYALYFYLPQGVKAGEERNIDVQLADGTQRRYPDATLRYRRVYMAPDRAPSGAPETTVVTAGSGRQATSGNTEEVGGSRTASGGSSADSAAPTLRRRRAVNEPTGSAGPASGSDGGWRPADSAPAANTAADTTTAEAAKPARTAPKSDAAKSSDPPPDQGGWRRVDESDSQGDGGKKPPQ